MVVTTDKKIRPQLTGTERRRLKLEIDRIQRAKIQARNQEARLDVKQPKERGTALATAT